MYLKRAKVKLDYLLRLVNIQGLSQDTGREREEIRYLEAKNID